MDGAHGYLFTVPQLRILAVDGDLHGIKDLQLIDLDRPMSMIPELTPYLIVAILVGHVACVVGYGPSSCAGDTGGGSTERHVRLMS